MEISCSSVVVYVSKQVANGFVCFMMCRRIRGFFTRSGTIK